MLHGSESSTVAEPSKRDACARISPQLRVQEVSTAHASQITKRVVNNNYVTI